MSIIEKSGIGTKSEEINNTIIQINVNFYPFKNSEWFKMGKDLEGSIENLLYLIGLQRIHKYVFSIIYNYSNQFQLTMLNKLKKIMGGL